MPTPRKKPSTLHHIITRQPRLSEADISLLTKDIPALSPRAAKQATSANEKESTTKTLELLQFRCERYIRITKRRYYPLLQNNSTERVFKTVYGEEHEKNENWITRINLVLPEDYEKIYKAQEKVRKKLGEQYLTKTYHEYPVKDECDFITLYYVTESEFLPKCLDLKGYIESIEEINKKIEVIFRLTTLLYNMVRYFEEKGIIWTDLKPDNILVVTDEGGIETLYISDMKAMCTREDDIYNNYTPQYAPPEICSLEKNTLSLEMYPALLRYTFGKTIEDLFPPEWETHPRTEQIKNFLRALLADNPEDRLSIHDATILLTSQPIPIPIPTPGGEPGPASDSGRNSSAPQPAL